MKITKNIGLLLLIVSAFGLTLSSSRLSLATKNLGMQADQISQKSKIKNQGETKKIDEDKVKKVKYEDIPKSYWKEIKEQEKQDLKEAKEKLIKKISQKEYDKIVEKEKKNEFKDDNRSKEEVETEEERVMKILEELRESSDN